MLVRSGVMVLRVAMVSSLIGVVVMGSTAAEASRVDEIVVLLDAGNPVFWVLFGPKTPEARSGFMRPSRLSSFTAWRAGRSMWDSADRAARPIAS